LLDRRVLAEDCLDLAWLDPKSTDFDLLIEPSQDFEIT
jgi:hypothetical protein